MQIEVVVVGEIAVSVISADARYWVKVWQHKPIFTKHPVTSPHAAKRRANTMRNIYPFICNFHLFSFISDSFLIPCVSLIELLFIGFQALHRWCCIYNACKIHIFCTSHSSRIGIACLFIWDLWDLWLRFQQLQSQRLHGLAALVFPLAAMLTLPNWEAWNCIVEMDKGLRCSLLWQPSS